MLQISKYEIFEIGLDNTGLDKAVEEKAAVFEFSSLSPGERERVELPAFRCGEGDYRIRFMPMREGTWCYRIHAGNRELQGEFLCTAPAEDSHGPVRTKGDGFIFDDGGRYIPFGTTCYAWINQTEKLQDETLETLKNAPFNKIRMCVFPKSMPYNNNDPQVYPFRRREDGSWDMNRPEPAFWDNLDRRISQLAELGIEADLILFHPYDRWGFAELPLEDSIVYLRYCIARLSAHANIWWSLANEYEMVRARTLEDWNRYGEILMEEDPCGHLRSIHNFLQLYPKKPWMTHCSVQSGEIDRILVWKEEYGLPVLIDECGYEGDIEYEWGNLTGFEMVHRFWKTVCRGGFCTHGETFHREDEVLWWAKGGKLYGESAPRIAFLKELLYSLPGDWEPIRRRIGNPNADPRDTEQQKEEEWFRERMKQYPREIQESFVGHTPLQISSESFRLLYLGHARPSRMQINLPDSGNWRVEIIDIWEMTRSLLAEGVKGSFTAGLPAKEGIAVLMRRLD